MNCFLQSLGQLKFLPNFFSTCYHVFCYKIQIIKDKKIINTFLESSRNVLSMLFSSLLLKMAINVCFGVLKLQDVSCFLINFEPQKVFSFFIWILQICYVAMYKTPSEDWAGQPDSDFAKIRNFSINHSTFANKTPKRILPPM